MDDFEARLKGFGVIPVVKIDDAADAVPLAAALSEAGLGCAEITFRTDAAEEAIKNIKRAFPDFFVAAGTVLQKNQVDRAVAAGAELIVAPGFNDDVVNYCINRKIRMIPGVATPSEIEKASYIGLCTVKLFPADILGGPAYIKAVSAPYRHMKFMPTGGINKNNLKDYLALNNVICCGGSWFVKGDLISKRDFDTIRSETADALKLVKEAGR
ncbi:MAG: bifunctional 4-hydroxy-2-oxoglutarate aldolase/2-dehydro-3-deoxy-phosphogluconate aldolase [Clostridia bacterium]|nr:bifunctional 4-hydroxy-2-oxoglutarate aldolase/2-dehydro-3-deoxy-phosphogluconate aldolase [Clostridia bacterium]